MDAILNGVSPPQKIEAVVCLLPRSMQNLLGFCFQMGMYVERAAEKYPDAVIYSNGVAVISRGVHVQIFERDRILKDIATNKFTNILVLEPNTSKKGFLRRFVNEFIKQLKGEHHVITQQLCAV